MITFNENFSTDESIDLNTIEIDEAVSSGYLGALETITWIEEQNVLFCHENAALDVCEVLSESEVFNEAAGTWIKERVKKVKDLVANVFKKIKGFLKKAAAKVKGLFSKKDKKALAAKITVVPASASIGVKYVEVTDKGFVSSVLADAASVVITNSNKVVSYATRFRNDSKTQKTDTELSELNNSMESFSKEDAADMGKYFANNGAVTTKNNFTTADAKAFIADDGSKYIKGIETTIGKLNKTQKDLESSISKLESAAQGISDTARLATLINLLSKKMSEGCTRLASLCGSYIKTINKEISTKTSLVNKLAAQGSVKESADEFEEDVDLNEYEPEEDSEGVEEE